MNDTKPNQVPFEHMNFKDAKGDSIEQQVAVKTLAEMYIAGKEIPTDLEYGMWWWMRKVLKDHVGVWMPTKDKNFGGK
jgi:hypothetical protein